MALMGAGRREEALDPIRHVTIWQHGVTTSLAQFAREQLLLIEGPAAAQTRDPVAVVLSMAAQPDRWKHQPVVWIPTQAVRRMVGMRADAVHASWSEVQECRALQNRARAARRRARAGWPLTAEEQEVVNVRQRVQVLNGLFQQHLHLVPPSASESGWQPVLLPEGYPPPQQVSVKRAWALMLHAVTADDPAALQEASQRFRVILCNLNPSLETAAGWAPSAGAVSVRVAPRDSGVAMRWSQSYAGMW